MLSSLLRPVSYGAVAGATVFVVGCQQYEPRPLDLASHKAAWQARTPGDETVRAFAHRLASQEASSGFEPNDGLSVSEAEIVALVYNPDLRLARLQAGVVSASAEDAGRSVDPEFSLDLLHVTEDVANPWVITPGLAFTVPISGRLQTEQARADAALRVALREVAEAEWAIRLELRERWMQWSAAMMKADEIERLLKSIDVIADMSMRLASIGEMPSADAGLLEIEQSIQKQALRQARLEAEELEQRVRMLMGLTPDAEVACIPILQLSNTADSTDDEIDSHSLRRLRESYEVAEKTLQREIQKQYPDLVIGPLYETDQGQSRIGFLGAIPLPIFNANRKGIAEARAERELARAAFETEYEKVVSQRRLLRIRLDRLHESLHFLESEMVPLVDQQLSRARQLLELGEVSVLVLVESLKSAGQVRNNLIDTRLDCSLAGIAIEGLSSPAIQAGQHADEIGVSDSSRHESPIPALEIIP
ncbi:MAG: TolC family protein [Phycisphaerales bacterium]|nr:TolC family protein [Phycisphaerales bacterium]